MNTETRGRALSPRRWWKGLLVVACVSGLAGAFGSGWFRDAEGFLTGDVCFAVAASVGVAVWAFAAGTAWAGCAGWVAVCLIGQAATLQLIDAGPRIHYQHYWGLEAIFQGHRWVYLAVAVGQAALVVSGLRGKWSAVWWWLTRHFRWWQLAGIAGAFYLFTVSPSREKGFYAYEIVFGGVLQTVQLGSVLLMAWSVPSGAAACLRGLIRDDDPSVAAARIDRWVAWAAVWVTVLSAGLSVYSYGRHPHVADEVAYLYHARFFAEGALTLPAPPVTDAFSFYLMEIDGGRWFPCPPPGWPIALAVGVFFGVPWLVNPVLGGLNILLAGALIAPLAGRRTARAVVWLLALSPWYVFMAMNYMTHTFSLTCALAGALLLEWSRRSGRPGWAWGGGAAVGMLSLIRPLEGLIVAAALGLWAIGLGGKRVGLGSLAGLVLGTAVVGGLTLPYNRYLTGDAKKFPIMTYTDKYYGVNSNAFGFGPDRGAGWGLDPNPGHGLVDATINTVLNLFSLNIELHGWGVGSLLLMAVVLFLGKMRGGDWLVLGTVAAVVGAHIFYWFSGGPDFGARYWYLVIVPCVCLAVRGMDVLAEMLRMIPAVGGLARERVYLTAAVLSLMAVVNYFPWRAIDKYHNYLNMRPDVRRLAQEHGFGRSLVLVRGPKHPDYVSAAVYNPLDLQADAPIYADDHDAPTRDALMRVYSDRPVWLVNGPTLTGRGFEVVAGPLRAEAMMSRHATAPADTER